MSLNIIKEMKLNDVAGTAFDVSALSNQALKKVNLVLTGSAEPGSAYNAGNNLIVGTNSTPTTGSYGLKNTDVKSEKAVRLWPGKDGSSASEIDLMGDGAIDAGVEASKVKQVHIKAMISKEKFTPNLDNNKVIRLKQTCSELELNNKNSTGSSGETYETAGKFDIKVKYDNAFQDCNLKARSIDIRANATESAVGKGGGIAVQIASCDNNRNENKFKIETSRKKAPAEGLMPSGGTYSEWYTTEGGKGIEIGTINSQFESLGCKEIRRMADSSVFAVTRSAVRGWKDDGTECEPTSEDAVKWDYITQSDDTKDIKSASQPSVKWVDLINAAIYLKAKGNIPSDGSFIPSVNVSYSLTNVTATNSRSFVLKSEDFTQVLTATSGTIAAAPTVTVGGTDVTGQTTWNTSNNTLTIPSAQITGAIVITASAS